MAFWEKLKRDLMGPLGARDRDPAVLLGQALGAVKRCLALHEHLKDQVQSPWLKEQMEKLAKEDREVTAQLEEKLHSLGGSTEVSFGVESFQGRVAEGLIQDFNHERECQDLLRQGIGLIKEQKLKDFLSRLLAQKKGHLELLREVIMRYS